MAGAGGGPAGTAGMGQYQQVSQPRFVPRATRIISTNVCASLFTWCLLPSKSHYWVSTIFPKIPVLSLVTQSLVTHKECKCLFIPTNQTISVVCFRIESVTRCLPWQQCLLAMSWLGHSGLPWLWQHQDTTALGRTQYLKVHIKPFLNFSTSIILLPPFSKVVLPQKYTLVQLEFLFNKPWALNL